MNHKNQILSQIKDSGLHIIQIEAITGGDINEAFKVVVDSGESYFLKYNTLAFGEEIIKGELMGLALLKEGGCRVPQVRAEDVSGLCPFILMEWIDHGLRNNKSVAEALTQLHSNTNTHYGLDHNNCIGSLFQKNNPSTDFYDFYWTNRLEPQLKLAWDKGFKYKASSDAMHKVLTNEIPSEKPALIHGDLWSGNLIDGRDGPCFIDPSVSYCHREMDLAMMRLFGGFDSEIFEIYNELMPLESGWHNRADLFQLYYLLVHYNLFGEGYRSAVEKILNKYFK